MKRLRGVSTRKEAVRQGVIRGRNGALSFTMPACTTQSILELTHDGRPAAAVQRQKTTREKKKYRRSDSLRLLPSVPVTMMRLPVKSVGVEELSAIFTVMEREARCCGEAACLLGVADLGCWANGHG